jgi:hypothetical protein
MPSDQQCGPYRALQPPCQRVVQPTKKHRVRSPNRRLAGSLRQLTLVATLSVGTVFAQDTAIVQDSLIVPDPTITQDTRQGMVPRQDMIPIGWEGKLRFHAKSAYGPAALARAAVSSAYLLGIDSPPEWGQTGWATGSVWALR